MRISDWSSDVCSSDLTGVVQLPVGADRDLRGFLCCGDFRFRYRSDEERWSAPRLASLRCWPAQRGLPWRRLRRGRRGALHLVVKRQERDRPFPRLRSEEHTSELQSLMRISYAVFCLKTKKTNIKTLNVYLKEDIHSNTNKT